MLLSFLDTFLLFLFQAVLILECWVMHKEKYFPSKNVAFANHLLIINLALADLLMGLYLLILSIFDALYSGIYCLKSMEWLSSNTCSFLGVLVVVSSQTSVLTLVILGTVRLITVLDVSVECDLHNLYMTVNTLHCNGTLYVGS